MAALRLAVGCGDYDRTRALLSGAIQAEGIEIDWEVCPVPHQLFVRVQRGEFDAAEMSMSGLTTMIARGDDQLIGIPVFTSRLFRHSFVFVNPERGVVKRPEDLIGKRVGLTDYSVTAAVWIRGFLQHDHGVAPEQVQWLIGGLNDPNQLVPLATERPSNVHVEQIPAGTCLNELLEAGEIDALGSPGLPLGIIKGSPRVQRLFPNYREVEADYYRRTGIVPIMHVFVVRRTVYEKNPWVAESLFRGFERAKEICYHALAETGAPKATLVWLQSYLESERAIFGPDHWPYGFAANRKTIEALTRYVHEQGLAARLVPPERLFATETLALD